MNNYIDLNFYRHLENQGYVVKTREYYCQNAYYYKEWIKQHNITIVKSTYKDLMNYVGYLQDQGRSTVIINKHLKSIERYYNYLQLPNIASGIKLKEKQANSRLFLVEKEIDTLYEHYNGLTTSYWKYSNKLFLSLTCYQALERQDLLLLKKSDVDLEKGTIYVPGGKHIKNGRVLQLKAHQIIPLQHYITHRWNHQVLNGCPSKNTELLFLPQAESILRIGSQLTQIHKSLMVQTKDLAFCYQSLQQLRQSRIVEWIKQYGLRQAQYLSGHKGITSIERYQKQDIEDLRNQIKKFHPLG